MKLSDLDAFTRAYLVCALWSSNDESNEQGGDPMDQNYGLEDIAEETLDKAAEDCKDFQRFQAVDLAAAKALGADDEQNGHDFWLTRNHHGEGFWDRGYGDVGDRLSEACKPYGEVNLYVGDDKKIHAD